MDHKKGLLYDMYRLYLSIYIYIWDCPDICKNVVFFQKTNKIIDRVINIYEKHNINSGNHIFNNPEYFGESLLDDEITYESVVDFIENYEVE